MVREILTQDQEDAIDEALRNLFGVILEPTGTLEDEDSTLARYYLLRAIRAHANERTGEKVLEELENLLADHGERDQS